MSIKVYKPTTSARRRTSIEISSELTKKKPEKKLRKIKKSTGGRGAQGRITIRHRGGGARKYFRVIDFRQDKYDIPAKVVSIERDPNRGARIALLNYIDGEKRYIIASQELKVGDKIVSSQKKGEPRVGNRMPLEYIPIGMMVYNVELVPGRGGQLARGAGTGIQVMAIERDYAQLKLPSGEIRLVPKQGLATIGQVSNPEHRLVRIGKAGRSRHLGRRPTVRGKAMTPRDHPHGGGEGQQPIGLKHPKTPWGKPALGMKTRQKGKKSDKFIIRRRKKKK